MLNTKQQKSKDFENFLLCPQMSKESQVHPTVTQIVFQCKYY